MKKVLRFIGILLLVVVGVVLITGLFAPKDISAERTIMINAPQSVVAEQMLQYSNFRNWSPWQHLDSNMKSEVIGPEMTAGTKYKWSGNKDVGSGEMEIKEAKTNEIQYAMHFKEPWESEADGYWRIEDAGNGQSKAVWGFKTHVGYPNNAIMMIMGMKNMLAKDFDKGLNKLKELAEKRAQEAPANNISIQEIAFPGHNYACIKQTVNISDMSNSQDFFNKAYTTLGKVAGARIAGPASGLYFTWDEQKGTTDMAAAFPVSGNEPMSGATMHHVAPSKAYQVVYNGGYNGSMQAHEALGKHIAEKGEQQQLVIEEYIKGPGEEKDSTKWVTNIIYIVK